MQRETGGHILLSPPTPSQPTRHTTRLQPWFVFTALLKMGCSSALSLFLALSLNRSFSLSHSKLLCVSSTKGLPLLLLCLLMCQRAQRRNICPERGHLTGVIEWWPCSRHLLSFRRGRNLGVYEKIWAFQRQGLNILKAPHVFRGQSWSIDL